MANKRSKQLARAARKSMKGNTVSASPARNMQQIVSHNVDDKGKKFSYTQHVPIDPSRPVRHPNHAYMRAEERYFQPRA